MLLLLTFLKNLIDLYVAQIIFEEAKNMRKHEMLSPLLQLCVQ